MKDQLDVTCYFIFHFLCAQHVLDINISIIRMDILMSETCWAHKKWKKNSKWHQVGLSFFNYGKGPL